MCAFHVPQKYKLRELNLYVFLDFRKNSIKCGDFQSNIYIY